MKTTSKKEINDFLKIQTGEQVNQLFNSSNSLKVLSAVQLINKSYGDRRRHKTPLYIHMGMVKYNEAYFAV